jgi:hypothetical protein
VGDQAAARGSGAQVAACRYASLSIVDAPEVWTEALRVRVKIYNNAIDHHNKN